MKLLEKLIRKLSLSKQISEEEIHRAVMFQFEYVNKSVKDSNCEIELSGIGYFKVNSKKLEKEYYNQLGLEKSLSNCYEREQDPQKKNSYLLKLNSIREELRITQLKKDEFQKNLEKQAINNQRSLE